MPQMNFEDIEIQEMTAKIEATTEALDRLCKDIIHTSLTRQYFAAINGISYQYVSEFLNTNSGQRRMKLSMLVAILLAEPDESRNILGFLCELTGYEKPEKKRTKSTEETLEILLKKIRTHGLEDVFLKDL